MKNLWPTLMIAVGTMVLTLALLAPVHSRAVDDAAKPENPAPALEVQGAKIKVSAEPGAFKVGDTPQVVLHMENPTAQVVQAKVQVQMLADRPTPPESRVIRMPESLRHEDVNVVLQPGQKLDKTITADKAATNPGQLIVRMSEGKNMVESRPARVGGNESPKQQENEAYPEQPAAQR